MCGKEAGIEDSMFLMFGTLLGAIRERDFISHDDDIDVGILSHKVGRGQEANFKALLDHYGLFKYRRKIEQRPDTHKMLWMSAKREIEPKGVKSCIWFMFPWHGYMFHCKGSPWLWKIGQGKRIMREISQAGIKGVTTFAKGNSQKWFEPLRKIRFAGAEYNIPHYPGALLDELYPGWAIPRQGGASSQHVVIAIRKWTDEKTWLAI